MALSAAMPASAATAAAKVTNSGRLWLLVLAVLAAGLFAFWGTWNGQFVFDDQVAIEGNEALRRGDWWGAAFGDKHQPLANRPLSTLSIAIDFWIFGVGPFGPHLTNLLLHLANGVLLLLVVRRVLLTPNLRGGRAASHADGIAAAIAVLWVAHPLASDAVAYATQRSTLLFSGCLLVTLWCLLRASGPHRRRWLGASFACLCLGMASKEDFVVVPLLVLLFVRAFLVPSWRELRKYRGFLLAAAATWSVLALCVWLGPSNATVGFHTEPRVSAFEWLLTQAGVVWHYVRLTLWPSPLRGAYDWDYVRDVGPAVLPGLCLLALSVLTVVAFRRQPWLGWLGALFFLLLGPTSSVMPIVTEVVAERRAYLPMLGVLVPLVVVASQRLPRPVATLAVAALAIALGWCARAQVAVYRDEPSFWADAFAKRTVGSRSHLAAQILSNHGAMLFGQGQTEAAAALFDEAMECADPTVEERMHHAVSLQVRGRSNEAIAALEALVRQFPEHAEVHGSLGTTLLQVAAAAGVKADDVRVMRAEGLLRHALQLSPRRQAYWNSLGYVLELREQWAEAEAAYLRATELGQQRIEPFVSRARMLARLGRQVEIQPMFAALLAARPNDVTLRLQLAQQMIGAGNVPYAIVLLREVLRLDATQTQAAAALRELEARSGR